MSTTAQLRSCQPGRNGQSSLPINMGGAMRWKQPRTITFNYKEP